LLAEAIPALSKPVGANNTSALDDRNFNMPAQFVIDPNVWPRGKQEGTGIALWHHSDMGQIAYPYLCRFYNQLVSISSQ
jgi:hypothetical protein